jgi:hypothetical protein
LTGKRFSPDPGQENLIMYYRKLWPVAMSS